MNVPETPKPSRWLTLAPSIVALVATVGAGVLTYIATTNASMDRTRDALDQQRRSVYAQLLSAESGLSSLEGQASTDASNELYAILQQESDDLRAQANGLSTLYINVNLVGPEDVGLAAGNLSSSHAAYADLLDYIASVCDPPESDPTGCNEAKGNVLGYARKVATDRFLFVSAAQKALQG